MLVLTLAQCTAKAPSGLDPGESGMVLGVTHAQFSLDPQLSPAQRAEGERLLGATPLLQNQHLMGWGATNPEPSPGTYDWSDVDTRMRLVERTGGTPVLTLCCAPDWMKGGAPGTTDWDRLTVAPRPEHYRDFAHLAAEAARRYPQVHYFQVWNELKGFWDERANTWDAAGFTDFYNAVYDAVKRVRPDAKIGGPYVVFTLYASTNPPSPLSGAYGSVDPRVLALVRYWNEHKHGADFVAADASTATRDEGLITSPAAAGAVFSDVTRWLHGLTGLPVWWSEFYPLAPPGPGDPAGTDRVRAVLCLDAVARAAEAGAAAMLLWQPQDDGELPFAALWTRPRDGTPVGPTGLTEAWTWLAPRLRDRSVRVVRDVAGGLVRFEGRDRTLTLNVSGSSALRITGGSARTLPPYSLTFG
ncbi:hypothetical protein [Amycolatopsis rhizosphaerae]|uniref:hypothetical protein n=1 Tax=Amycolatopsis rhizosphaerae TaxID=2053003 RepID=UPI001643C3FF|nr:hypothetical protein [Amycolatopsis rhizosphaerae]